MYVFSDARTKAYGAVVYVCQQDQVSLVMSKSRVALPQTFPTCSYVYAR